MNATTKNTKYRCHNCGSIFDRPLSVFGPGVCENCGARNWERITTHPMCDFCGSEDPMWSFPCESFPMSTAELGLHAGPTQMSSGDWSACDTCKELVERDDLTALSRRASNVFLGRNPGAHHQRQLIETANGVSHRSFIAHRTGPAKRL